MDKINSNGKKKKMTRDRKQQQIAVNPTNISPTTPQKIKSIHNSTDRVSPVRYLAILLLQLCTIPDDPSFGDRVNWELDHLLVHSISKKMYYRLHKVHNCWVT